MKRLFDSPFRPMGSPLKKSRSVAPRTLPTMKTESSPTTAGGASKVRSSQSC